jgi:hypothetical protein
MCASPAGPGSWTATLIKQFNYASPAGTWTATWVLTPIPFRGLFPCIETNNPKSLHAYCVNLPCRHLDRHLDADEAVVLGAGLFAANLSSSFRLRVSVGPACTLGLVILRYGVVQHHVCFAANLAASCACWRPPLARTS